MKHLKVLLLAVFLSGICAPVFATPFPEQLQQFVQNQPQETDPRAANAQQAFELAVNSYAENAVNNSFNDIEKQINQILESKDLAASLQASASTVIQNDTLESITTEEEFAAKLEELAPKLLVAYRQNKYVKQLIPLFFANQNQFKAEDIDQQTFDALVIASVNMMLQIQQMLQQQAE